MPREWSNSAPWWMADTQFGRTRETYDEVLGRAEQAEHNMHERIREVEQDAKLRIEQAQRERDAALAERDSWRSIAEQRWALRREVEELLSVPEGASGDEQFRAGVEAIRALRTLLAAKDAGPLGAIARERARQVNTEGWTPEHDDSHRVGELAQAAAVYAMPPVHRTPTHWPWPDGYKPTEDRERELVKAGALIVAELERLARLRAKGKEELA